MLNECVSHVRLIHTNTVTNTQTTKKTKKSRAVIQIFPPFTMYCMVIGNYSSHIYRQINSPCETFMFSIILYSYTLSEIKVIFRIFVFNSDTPTNTVFHKYVTKHVFNSVPIIVGSFQYFSSMFTKSQAADLLYVGKGYQKKKEQTIGYK